MGKSIKSLVNCFVYKLKTINIVRNLQNTKFIGGGGGGEFYHRFMNITSYSNHSLLILNLPF